MSESLQPLPPGLEVVDTFVTSGTACNGITLREYYRKQGRNNIFREVLEMIEEYKYPVDNEFSPGQSYKLDYDVFKAKIKAMLDG